MLTGQLEDDISAFDSPDGDATKLTDGLKNIFSDSVEIILL